MPGEITVTPRGEECDVEWKMNFDSLLKKDNVFYWSPEFSFEGEYWQFTMRPNGSKEMYSNGYIHLRVYKSSSDNPPIRMEISFSLKTVNGEKDSESRCTEVFHGHSFHDFYRFFSISDLEKRRSEFLDSGFLILICTLKKMNDPGRAIATNTIDPDVFHRHEKILQDFKQFFLNKENCDVVLRVKGREFPAHKSILAARSPVFASTFRNDMKEKETGIVEIKDCDPSVFSDFLGYLCSGDLDSLSEENVFGLFTVADKYNVQDLREMCLDFLKENLSVDTFCETITLALLHNETELVHIATNFFIKNARKILVTVKWQTFLAENLTFSNELVIKFAESVGGPNT